MNNYILYAILILTGLLGTYAIIPLFRSLLIESNVLRPNYKKDMIPVSMGIVFLPMLIINAIILAYFTTNFKDMLHIFIFLFGLVSMFFAGILDDIIGNRDVSGLKGHFKSLLNGKLTTGGFKALFGGFIGLVISIAISKNIYDIVINTLISTGSREHLSAELLVRYIQENTTNADLDAFVDTKREEMYFYKKEDKLVPLYKCLE